MIYGVVSLVFFLLMRKKINWVIQLAFIVCIPFFGIILLLFLYKDTKNENGLPNWLIQKMEDDQGDILQKDKADVHQVVPFQDALIFNDNQLKRKMLLNLLKKDSFQNVSLLRAALENEDTETSHFAATAILDTKSKIGLSIQQLEVELDKDPYNLEKLISISKLLFNSLEIEFVDHQTKKKYLYNYTTILERIIELDPFNPSFFIKKIESDLELGEYQNARDYCKLFRQSCPDHEESYFQSMKLYHKLQDQAGFDQTLDDLRNAPIKMSQQGLQKLRFWIEGEGHEDKV